MRIFAHLRSYSDYSLLFAANKPKMLVDLAVENKIPAIALTDRNNLCGSLEFSEYATAAGVQSIVGIDIDVIYRNIKSDILLLAKNHTGFKNLIYLSGLISKQNISLNDIFKKKEGLIVLSGNILKDVIKSKAINTNELATEFINNFGSDFFIELQRTYQGNKTEKKLLEIAYQHNIPIVATNSVLFPTNEFAQSHDILTCIAEGDYISNHDRRKFSSECYFKTTEQMCSLFYDLEEAIKNTVLIARKCTFMPEVKDPILPQFQCDTTEDEHLKKLAYIGIENKFDQGIPENYLKRLEYELDVIIKMKYSGYFLIVADFINWSKKNGIPVGPGRGSGVGSIVAWSLGITGLDPIYFGLLFERFLNPVRVSMPDFDIDFCQEKRHLVIEYIRKKYGHVAQIVTFGSLQPRAALRDVGRVLQLPYSRVDRICKMIPHNPANPISLQEAIDIDKNLQEERDNDDSIKKLLDISLKLEGILRHSSTHAAGIVISDKPVDEYLPVYYEENSDIPVTQYSMKYVEKAGLIKFDFLGLKTLTMIDWASRLILVNHPEFDIEKIKLDDKQTYDLLSSGRSIGIFQLENAFMCEALKKLKPDTIDDIIALISLNRPGPMANIPIYIARKHGKEKIEYPHPLLKEALSETFGVVIYQEQVMEIARLLAGYSLAEADILRRAMGKKIRSEMKMQNEKFIQGAIANNIIKEKAQEIFEMVEKFAGYGFNKSHAAAYALISYQTAFLKANFPLEFFTALLNLEINNTDKLSSFVQDAKNFGIKILPPDVNRSFSCFKIEDGAIRYALSALKNVGEAAAEFIENKHNFKTIEDFAHQIDPKIINKRALEGLIKSGVLDSIYENRAALFASVEDILNCHTNSTNQIALFDIAANKLIKQNIPEWNFFEKTKNEFEGIGLFLQNHPIDIYKKFLKLPHSKMVGVIINVRIRSRGERKFAVLQLSTTENIYTVIFYETQIIEQKTTLFVVGCEVVVDILKNENGIVGTNIYPLKNFILKSFGNKIIIKIDNQQQVKLLSNILKKDGNFEVIIVLKKTDGYTQILLGNDFSFSLEELALIEGINILKY